MSSTHYFAYGSNMDPVDMRARCQDAVFLEVGTIETVKFAINTQGVATVVRDDQGLVHGTLWRISAADEQALDQYERVELGLYTKTTMDVRLEDGGRRAAMVYVATDERPGTPRADYMANIVAAARAHRFPPSYISELRAWLTEA